ncbi:MAG: MarR family transcriptional regulator [Gemmatimonadota bacterium]|nr:MarR family transcriptional regulator [Gemmatimonadota bacterium]
MTTKQPGAESAIVRELQQTRPFHSIGAEAIVSLMRTASLIQRRIHAIVQREGITQPQYNVLRILRGAGDAGLPTLAIRDRMIDASPGVTRLVDRLERAGYARRRRSAPDRRQVMCHITPAGLALLARLDAPIFAYDDEAVAMLSVPEKRDLLHLLDAIRGARPPA